MVNTCGWVEGLGAEILMQFAKTIDRPSTQFIFLESNNKYCEVDLSVLGVWLTKITGDVRAPATAQRIVKQSSKVSEGVSSAKQSESGEHKIMRNKRFVNSLLPPVKPDAQHKYKLDKSHLFISQAYLLAL